MASPAFLCAHVPHNHDAKALRQIKWKVERNTCTLPLPQRARSALRPRFVIVASRGYRHFALLIFFAGHAGNMLVMPAFSAACIGAQAPDARRPAITTQYSVMICWRAEVRFHTHHRHRRARRATCISYSRCHVPLSRIRTADGNIAPCMHPGERARRHPRRRTGRTGRFARCISRVIPAAPTIQRPWTAAAPIVAMMLPSSTPARTAFATMNRRRTCGYCALSLPDGWCAIIDFSMPLVLLEVDFLSC